MTEQLPEDPLRTNRRSTARLACLLGVRYRHEGGWHPAMVLDLSERGCRLRLGEELKRGAAVTVVFERPLDDGAPALQVEAAGKVTWARLEGLSYQAGIHFLAEATEVPAILAALR